MVASGTAASYGGTLLCGMRTAHPDALRAVDVVVRAVADEDARGRVVHAHGGHRGPERLGMGLGPRDLAAKEQGQDQPWGNPEPRPLQPRGSGFPCTPSWLLACPAQGCVTHRTNDRGRCKQSSQSHAAGTAEEGVRLPRYMSVPVARGVSRTGTCVSDIVARCGWRRARGRSYDLDLWICAG